MIAFAQRPYICLLLFVCLLHLSCGSSRKVQRVALDPITVTANRTALQLYRASATRYWDIVHTRAALRFNYAEKTANGRAWLRLRPWFYDMDSIVLDAKTMEIHRVAFAGDTTRALPYRYEDNQIIIKPGTAYGREDTIDLYIRYKAMPEQATSGGSDAISDDKGLYFINTDHAIPGKPAQIWTQGETEANSHWLPTIDKPNERFSVQLELTVPDSFVTLSNGELIGQQPTNGQLRTDIWRMDEPIQTYAIMLAVGRFSVVKDEWKGKEVSYYVEPEYEAYARRMFQHTPEMMDFFSEITGVPYPWNKYSQIVVRDYVSGAMENTTASVFGEFMNQNFREMADKDYEDIVSHELFHQWFGDYVTAESWANLTLNESFANYGQQLWRLYKYGKANADELAFKDLQTYLDQAENNDPSLVRYHYEHREDMFDRVSYQKGGAILNYLHGLIGDEAFYKAMNRYLTQNALQSAEAAEWRLAVEDVTGQDWNWFFDQWYFRSGHPVLSVDYDYDDAIRQMWVTVRQQQDALYELPLKTLVAYSDSDKTVVDWRLTERKQSFVYPYRGGRKPVVVPDVNHWLVGELQENNKRPEQWRTQYSLANDFISRYRALIHTATKTTDTATQALLGQALGDTNPSLREAALQVLQPEKRDNLKDKWRSHVRHLAEFDGSSKVRAAAIQVLHAWKDKEALPLIYASLEDLSYAVAGASLRAISGLQKDTAYTIAKHYLGTDPKADLQDAVWETIAAEGRAADIAVFENDRYRVAGAQKINLAIALAIYLQKAEDDAAFSRALQVHKELIYSESIQSYRLAMGAYLAGAAAGLKEQVADSRNNIEKAEGEQRLEQTRLALEEVVQKEKDPENRSQYKIYMKKLFRQ